MLPEGLPPLEGDPLRQGGGHWSPASTKATGAGSQRIDGPLVANPGTAKARGGKTFYMPLDCWAIFAPLNINSLRSTSPLPGALNVCPFLRSVRAGGRHGV
jgi:hypothetical protein